MSNTKFLSDVIKYDRYQPEFYEDTKTYISKRTSSKKVSLGKKYVVKDDSVSYSYVWIYDKNTGLPASEEQCKALPKKD